MSDVVSHVTLRTDQRNRAPLPSSLKHGRILIKIQGENERTRSRSFVLTWLFRTRIDQSKKRKRKKGKKKHARGTNLLDLPPCTETVVTCSRPPKSTIARYPPFPLVSYVKTVFVRANDRERRLIHRPRFGREMDGLVSRREADQKNF